jgi:hypothetical protein
MIEMKENFNQNYFWSSQILKLKGPKKNSFTNSHNCSILQLKFYMRWLSVFSSFV